MMKRNNLRLVTSGALLALSCYGTQALADRLISNTVPNLTTRTLATVPAGQVFLLDSVLVTTNVNTPTCCQRVYRSGTAVTSFVSVQARDTVQLEFDPPIRYQAGQTVQVRNGASAGGTSWTLNFTRLTN